VEIESARVDSPGTPRGALLVEAVPDDAPFVGEAIELTTRPDAALLEAATGVTAAPSGHPAAPDQD